MKSRGVVTMIIAHYLNVVVSSGYWQKEQWQAWADELIVSHDELEDFVDDISVAEDESEVGAALREQWYMEVFDGSNNFYIEEIVVGYYYLMFKEGRMSLLELFERLMNDDDISSSSTAVEWEEREHIFNELRMGVINIERIDELLAPLIKPAKEQLEAILSYMKV